jgi:hypothetical protein
VRAGHEVGVTEIPVQSAGDFGPLATQALGLLGRVPAPEVNIVNMIPPKFAQYRVPGARKHRLHDVRDRRLPADWTAQCNAMDAIWVPSQWVREMFVSSGVRVPVSVVGVDALAPPWVAPPDAGHFRLLSVFEWSERKNPLGLLRAWCAAFDGDDGVALTLKVSRYPDPEKTFEYVQSSCGARSSASSRCARAAHRHRAARAVGAQMRSCTSAAIAYVSLAHAEGWGLPPWEATLAGRPVLHTAWSAPMEFVHPQGQVACNLAPVYGMAEFVSFYDGSMNWADAHLDDAIDKLRALRRDYARWSEVAQAHREDILARYSPAARLAQLQAALAA